MSHGRGNWFTQWNYDAPIWMFLEWKKKHKRLIKAVKTSFAAAFIIIFVAPIAGACFVEAAVTIASNAEAHEIKKREIAQLAREAREKEILIQKALQEAEAARSRDEELQKQLHYEMEVKALNEAIAIGDRVQITWWGTGAGPTPPNNNFSTGQITKINGLYIEGTWGGAVVDWAMHPHFEVLSSKEYKVLRDKEAKALQRKLNKKDKKFKSWGRYPG